MPKLLKTTSTLIVISFFLVLTGCLPWLHPHGPTIEELRDTVDRQQQTIDQMEQTIDRQQHTIIQMEEIIDRQQHTIIQMEETIDRRLHTIDQMEQTICQMKQIIGQIIEEGNTIPQDNERADRFTNSDTRC